VYHWIASDRSTLITSPGWGSPYRYIPRGWNTYLDGQQSFFLPIGCRADISIAGEGATRIYGSGYWHWLPRWNGQAVTLQC
jgi:hypothetical protein